MMILRILLDVVILRTELYLVAKDKDGQEFGEVIVHCHVHG